MNEEKLFEAMSDVGDDLLVMAEEKKFTSTWRKWGQMAAVAAVVLGLSAVAFPYLNGYGAKQAGGVETKGDNASPVADMSAVTYASGSESQVLEDTCDGIDPAEVPEIDAEVAEEETKEKEESMAAAPRTLTKAVCSGTWFYIEPLSEEMGVPPLGEELGKITQSEEEPDLVGCSVYTMPYSAWFTNYAVDNQPVTQCVYIRTPAGYRYGTTCNEKVISRFTMEDVLKAIEEENNLWLTDTFVQPIERMGGVEFTEAAELATEELNTMLWASTGMNTGVVVEDYWRDEETQQFVIPMTDVHWRLHRFLDGYKYIPSETEYYDLDRNALVYPFDYVTYEPVEITMRSAAILDETHLLLVVYVSEQEAVKEYLIRFDEDSWRYERITVK